MRPIFQRNGKSADNIKELLSQNLTLDFSALNEVLKFGFILGQKTPFKEIKRLHKLEPQKRETLTDEKEIKDLFVKSLRESIFQSISNSGKVGLFLSGGIDSSTLAIFLGKYFKDLKVFAYTAFFEGNEKEVKNAKEISKKYNFCHRILKIDNRDFNNWEKAIEAIGMPIADEASIPLFKMAERAFEDGIEKVLMGDGNDELWCGYDEYYLLKKIKQILPFYFPKLGDFLIKLNLPKIRGIGKLLKIEGKNWAEAVYLKNSFDLEETLPYCWLEQRYGIVKYFNLIPEFPYLSQKLIDLACNVPISLKLKKSNKWLIKEATATLDPIILKRKKRLMAFPGKKLFKANKNKVIEAIKEAKIVKYKTTEGYFLTHRKFIISLWYQIFKKWIK